MKRALLLSLSLLALVGCGDGFVPQPVHHPAAAQVQQMQSEQHHALPTQPVAQQAPVAQQPSEGPGWLGVAAGALAGYALGQSASPPPQVVRETRYIERPAPAAVPPSAPRFVAPTAPAPKAAAPAKVEPPKPVVVHQKFTPPPPPAPTRYAGPSGYSSVRQSQPSYSRR